MMLFAGVAGILLHSSVLPEDGHITVCPDTIITFTCSDSMVLGMRWFALPLLNEDNSPGLGALVDIGEPFTVEDVFTVTLVDRELPMGEIFGNYTSTLGVVVNDMIQNGTNVTCYTPNVASLLIIKQGLPLRPMVNIVMADYYHEHFTFVLSWESQISDLYYLVNATGMDLINTTSNTQQFNRVYNTPLEVTVETVNCAGSSKQATFDISRAGCGPPSPPVNGSVGEWTSSRVGAQVNYSCDTDLVLVGERVTYCSLPQLQWLPSSDDVECVQPPPDMVPKTDPTASSSRKPLSVPIIVGIAVPLVLVAVILFTLILLFAIYKKRQNRWKRSPGVGNNWNGGQELHQLTSSTGTVSTPHSPNSPLAPATVSPGPQFTVSPGPRAAVYSDVNRNGDTTSGNGTTPTVIYSETTNSRRMVMVSQDAHGLAQVTTVDAIQYATAGHRDTTSPPPPEEKYAQLTFKESLPPLPSLEPPVQYSSVRVSASSPADACEGAHACEQEAAGVVGGGGKHPLDLAITIDSVIQQLQQLIPYWWAVGEAAGLQRPVLKEIASHFKGNERESFAEVIYQVFVPGRTTWTQLAGVCEGAGFTDLASALLDSYSTGVLPVQVEEDDTLLRRTPTQPPPPVPPRGGDEDNEEGPPPSLPPPLAQEDVPLPVPPRLPLSADAAPPRPPKVSKPPAVPPQY